MFKFKSELEFSQEGRRGGGEEGEEGLDNKFNILPDKSPVNSALFSLGGIKLSKLKWSLKI